MIKVGKLIAKALFLILDRQISLPRLSPHRPRIMTESKTDVPSTEASLDWPVHNETFRWRCRRSRYDAANSCFVLAIIIGFNIILYHIIVYSFISRILIKYKEF